MGLGATSGVERTHADNPRKGGQGGSWLADEQVRWPVNYFKELGLYSMKEAHEKRQSSMR